MRLRALMTLGAVLITMSSQYWIAAPRPSHRVASSGRARGTPSSLRRGDSELPLYAMPPIMYLVTQRQVEAKLAGEPERQPEPDAFRDVELHLNTRSGEGYLLVRDSERKIDAMLVILDAFGWSPIDVEEAVDAFEFEDGDVGVQIWMYRHQIQSAQAQLDLIGRRAT